MFIKWMLIVSSSYKSILELITKTPKTSNIFSTQKELELEFVTNSFKDKFAQGMG